MQISTFLAAVGLVGTIFGIASWYFSYQGTSKRKISILITIIAGIVFLTFLFTYLSPPSGKNSVHTIVSTTQQITRITIVQTLAPSHVPSPSPTIPLTATPTTISAPTVISAGTVLYQANWSQGIAGWIGGKEWNAGQGMLLSDGSDCCGGRESIVTAPYQPQNIANYKVEAKIQFIRTDTICNGYSFGVMLRMDTNYNGYEGAVNLANGACTLAPSVATLRVDNTTQLASKPFVPDTGWHIYTVEVKGDQISYSIDGNEILTTIDNTHLAGGQIGIEDYNVQMNVSSFKVIAI